MPEASQSTDPNAPPSTTASAAPSGASSATPPAAATPPADSFITAAADAPKPDAGKVDPAAKPDAAAAPARPEWLPETLWDAEKGAAKADDVKALLTDAEAARAAKAALPKTAEEYKPEFPKDFKVPDGVKINVEDPRFKEAQQTAHSLGMSQEAFSAMLGLEAKRAIAQAEVLKSAVTARDAALGPNGTARVDTLHSQIDAYFDAPVAADMKRMLVTERNIAGMESVFAALAAQGVDTLRRAEGGGEQPGKIPGYAAMSTQQKFALADKRNSASR